ncbi:hypothetical protein L596_015591 [Steinernema carpocapsae]|uniref:Uncharacterized protein n=1 Tax=Steinernema carpocapsae TaxID=34508 RepID=A0A4U5NFL0_STECR|nr:hypothetical protein L596_015591 [Steinernema carpocapsae]
MTKGLKRPFLVFPHQHVTILNNGIQHLSGRVAMPPAPTFCSRVRIPSQGTILGAFGVYGGDAFKQEEIRRGRFRRDPDVASRTKGLLGVDEGVVGIGSR